ncbi:MAG TPA: amino acid ABC transporter permease [Candidatus Limnocylindrales bacterium]
MTALGGPDSPDRGGSSGLPGLRARRRRDDRGSALRSTLVALVSTVVVFGILAYVVVNSPGWPAVQASFLDADIFWASLPSIVEAFLVNVQLFLIAEVLILALALVLAVARSSTAPVLAPVRLMATVYVDVFRALPGVLVIYMLGFGIPGLGLPGVPTDPFLYAIIALTLIYSAYVSEVYRAGIASVHPSQAAAARSLGMSQLQALRHVVLPQAIRRVVPPLLNDFIGLQKDTVLVSYIGVVEVFRQSQIIEAGTFNFTPYLATALVFLVVTIPLARLTDWLIVREAKRSRPGGGAPPAVTLASTQARGMGGAL